MNNVREAIEYAEDVINGNIVAGELIRLACKRFLNDIADERYEFREKEVDRCLKFVNCLKHYTGSHSGKPFIMLPFQVFMTANLVGLYHKGTNKRKYTQAYIQLSRKQGKTFFAGALSLYFMLFDKEDAAEVLLVANSRSQAKDVDYAIIKALAEQLDPKKKTLQIFRDSIDVPLNKSRLKVLAAEAGNCDGFNCSVGLLDEVHEFPDTKMIDVIVSSQGMRERPLIMMITTAGFDLSKPCYTIRNYCRDVLYGAKQDESQFAAIYELDEDDKWDDESVWIKSNPSLGQTVKLEYIREQVMKAKNNPINEVGVKTKTLNLWCQSADVWIRDSIIAKSISNVNIESLGEDGEQPVCYVGVDLAAVSDLTAVSALVVHKDKYYFKTTYFLPESALEEKQNKELYKQWQRQGHLIVTKGNVTDYDYVLKELMELDKIATIQGIYYDSWNSTQFAISATELGLPMVPYSQAISNFNRPTKEFERLMLQGNVVIDRNDATMFCFRNVSIKTDHNGNAKPVKYNDVDKIDGVIAMLSALGGYLTKERYSNEIDVI
jgi:phage terminase large subunit-like protein